MIVVLITSSKCQQNGLKKFSFALFKKHLLMPNLEKNPEIFHV